MGNKKNRNSDPSYATTFKPAVVLGEPTIDDLMNEVYLTQHQEEFDPQGSQKIKFLGLDEPTTPDMNPVFTLQNEDPNAKLTVRPVKVRRKEGYTHTYLAEPELNARGIAIILMKKVEDSGEQLIYCNVRFLPYSTLKDIFLKSASDIITVELPSVNIVKLNVTLKLSNVGEVLYQTHKTEVKLENTTEAEVIKIKQRLEFEGAKQVAHIASQLIDITPGESTESSGQLAAMNVSLPSWSTTKKLLLGAAAIATITAVVTGGIALGAAAAAAVAASASPAAATAAASAAATAGPSGLTWAAWASGGLGGLLRNTVGLIGAFRKDPVKLGETYSASIGGGEAQSIIIR